MKTQFKIIRFWLSVNYNQLFFMKILSFFIDVVLWVGFLICFFSLVLLHLANWQLLSIIYLMFTYAFGLHINYKLSTLKN